ncbi:hypothetical protein HK098_003761 [Nowakowskiella sp. JEL0407]|nr:hypothetical protein HK098_003761 [Nowakowskiella sp. JEL0407]
MNAVYRILIDMLGPNKMLLIFSTLVCFGQTIFSLGISTKKFPILVLGRFLFGLGGESLEVAQARVTTDWFRGRGLAFALSLNLSFARIATALNDNISPWVESQTKSVAVASWVGLMVCLLSFACGVVVVHLDAPANRKLAGVLTHGEDDGGEGTEAMIGDEEQRPLISNKDRRNYEGTGRNYGSLSGIEIDDSLGENDGIASTSLPALSDEERHSTIVSEEYDEEDETIHWSQLKGFSGLFWLLCVITIMLYGSAVPFFHICTDFFQKKWYPGDTQMAGLVMSIPDLISAFGSPICGILVDKYGHRSTLLPFSALLLVLTHAMLNFTYLSPIIAMTVMGISYSAFAAALWPCVTYLVGRHQIATAYGFLTVALNISLFFFPLVVAKIRNWSIGETLQHGLLQNTKTAEFESSPLSILSELKNTNQTLRYDVHNPAENADFSAVEYFFMFLSFVAFILSTILTVLDWKYNDGVLAKPHLISSPNNSVNNNTIDNQALEEEDLTARVVSDGIMIPGPLTIIHHHHHRHNRSISTRNCDCEDDEFQIEGSLARSFERSVQRRVPDRLARSFEPQVGFLAQRIILPTLAFVLMSALVEVNAQGGGTNLNSFVDGGHEAVWVAVYTIFIIWLLGLVIAPITYRFLHKASDRPDSGPTAHDRLNNYNRAARDSFLILLGSTLINQSGFGITAVKVQVPVKFNS